MRFEFGHTVQFIDPGLVQVCVCALSRRMCHRGAGERWELERSQRLSREQGGHSPEVVCAVVLLVYNGLASLVSDCRFTRTGSNTNGA